MMHVVTVFRVGLHSRCKPRPSQPPTAKPPTASPDQAGGFDVALPAWFSDTECARRPIGQSPRPVVVRQHSQEPSIWPCLLVVELVFLVVRNRVELVLVRLASDVRPAGRESHKHFDPFWIEPAWIVRLDLLGQLSAPLTGFARSLPVRCRCGRPALRS